MSRMTRHDYAAPGSFDRVLEAAIALADTDSEDDRAWHRNKMRLLKATAAYYGTHLKRGHCHEAAKRFEEMWLEFDRRTG